MIGISLAHPLITAIGIFIGHLVDIGWFKKWIQHTIHSATQNQQVQTVFFNASFMIMGHIAKSDGHVTENEIRVAENVMDQMNLSESMKKEAIRFFNIGKQSTFNLDATLDQVRMACGNRPSLLLIFIEFQSKMVFADGGLPSVEQRKKLAYICSKLNIGGHYSWHDRPHHSAHDRREYTHNTLHEAYEKLGIPSTSNDAEVKKAYRRLMSQNHPDKLIAKGLPPEMIKIATQKTQDIKKAYETICAARDSR